MTRGELVALGLIYAAIAGVGLYRVACWLRRRVR